MMIVKNKEERTLIFFQDDGEKILEWSFFSDELVWLFYREHPIEITQKTNSFLYNGLQKIMDSSYTFSNPFCKQEKNKIEWFSDQTGDLENKSQSDAVSRLVIERIGETIRLSAHNPFFEKYDIKREKIIAFSPGGNGSYSKNKESGMTFQTEIALLFTEEFEDHFEESVSKLQMKKEA